MTTYVEKPAPRVGHSVARDIAKAAFVEDQVTEALHRSLDLQLFRLKVIYCSFKSVCDSL